jgi:SAM-dependent methyltransferase
MCTKRSRPRWVVLLVLTVFCYQAVQYESKTRFLTSIAQKRRPRVEAGVPDELVESNKHDTTLKEDPGGYENMHDHDAAFHFYNTVQLSPKLKAVYDFKAGQTINDVYASQLAIAAISDDRRLSILSIGSGDCSIELQVAKILENVYQVKPNFTCYEPSEAGRERAKITLSNLTSSDKSSFSIQDRLLPRPTEQPFDAIFAHHSLHHAADLEFIFMYIKDNMKADGTFVCSDMIGRNGHRRWPEQLYVAENLWRRLPRSSKHDFILNTDILQYPDYDYTCEGKSDIREGIRSQDILPLLVRNFHFRYFVAWGGISFEFVGRRLAQNFSPHTAVGKEFLLELTSLEEKLTSEGVIKPDQMIATLTHKASQSEQVTCWQHWTPTYCIRKTELDSHSTSVALNPCKK